MKTINRETYIKILHNNCDKSKHRFRTNHFGVSFCVICGLLSNKPAQEITNEDNLLIICQ